MLIRLAGRELRLDPAGVLYWPQRRLLVVADLHLEKAAALARAGRALLPPHDTAATLAKLEAVIERYRPETVVSLGDGFHDRAAAAGLEGEAFDRLARLVRGSRWIWIAGNHDPSIPLGLGGAVLDALALDGLVLRHAPGPLGAGEAEICGHLHPKARLAGARPGLARPCFVADGRRLLLPAFGAFAGGLDATDPAIAGLFPEGFTAWLLGERRLFPVASSLLGVGAAGAAPVRPGARRSRRRGSA